MPTDKKISELPIATSVNATDVSVLVNGDTDYQYTFTLLLQFLQANLSIGANISFGTTLPQNTSGNNGDVFVNTIAGSFAQKIAGTWTMVYTLSAANAADGSLLYGAGIPASGTGKNLDSYINTLTGIFYKKSAGTWAQVFSMATGPQGPQGTAGTNGANGQDGNTILFGTTNPSNTLTGINGNFYINTSSYTLFGPKTTGVWGDGVSLLGAGLPNGGTAGQILVKADGADFNTNWEDNSFANLTGDPAGNANLATALAAKQDNLGFTPENTTTKNQVNGYAGLDGSGKVAAAQLPSYVDDVLEFANFAALPVTGETGKIYITLDTNAEYRWSGSVYIQLVASPGSTDAVPEGSTNKYFTVSRVLASVLTGIGFSSATAITATDTILGAFGKLQAQVTALFKIPIGGTTGQILAKVDATDGNIHWIDAPSGGSGGSSGGANKQVQFNKAGAFAGNQNLEWDEQVNEVTVGTILPSYKGSIGFGDSITIGQAASDVQHSWFYKLSLYLGSINRLNKGIAASCMSAGLSGPSPMITRLAEIPAYDATSYDYLIFMYGVNDAGHGGNTTQFTTDYNAVIANALGKGWPTSKIIILSPTYQLSTSGANTLTSPFVTAAAAVAATNNVLYVDAFAYMSVNGGDALLSGDGTHPNDAGYGVIVDGITSTLSADLPGGGSVNTKGDINGGAISAVYDLVVGKNTDLKGGLSVGIGAAGTTSIVLDGATGFDIDLRFNGVSKADFYSTISAIRLLTESGIDIIFQSSNGAGGYLVLGHDGTIQLGGTGTTINDIITADPVSLSRFIKFNEIHYNNADNGAYISFAGHDQILSFNAVNNSQYSFGVVPSNGAAMSRKILTLDSDGGGVTIGDSVAIDNSAVLNIVSTTQGMLVPRMTTTQKLAIPSPAEGLQVYDLILHQMSYYNGTTWINF